MTDKLPELRLVLADLRAGLSALRLAEKMDGCLLIAETIPKLARIVDELDDTKATAELERVCSQVNGHTWSQVDADNLVCIFCGRRELIAFHAASGEARS